MRQLLLFFVIAMVSANAYSTSHANVHLTQNTTTWSYNDVTVDATNMKYEYVADIINEFSVLIYANRGNYSLNLFCYYDDTWVQTAYVHSCQDVERYRTWLPLSNRCEFAIHNYDAHPPIEIESVHIYNMTVNITITQLHIDDTTITHTGSIGDCDNTIERSIWSSVLGAFIAAGLSVFVVWIIRWCRRVHKYDENIRYT